MSSTPSDMEKAATISIEEVEDPALAGVYRRHGRVDLVPMPSDDPQDPLNWPSWQKNLLLFIVSFQSMQATFGGAMVIPAFEDFSKEFGVPLDRIAYLVSVQILFLGVTPLVWSPIADRIGRRPVYLLSTLVSAACALAGAYCHSYGTLMTARIFQSIFISPAMSLGACSVSEMFFSYQKGRKMGVFVLTVTCGPVLAPLATGYLVEKRGWQSAFYLLAGTHLGLFFLHAFFGPETLYPHRQPPGQADEDTSSAKHEAQERPSPYSIFRVLDSRPLGWRDFWHPFPMACRPIVLLTSIAMALPFAYTVALMTIFVPQLFGKIFHLSPGQIGLQFIALLIGAVLGEQLAGLGSDVYVSYRTKRAGGVRLPEYRLPLAYPGVVLCIVGIIVWGVQLQNATPGVWTVTPDVGSAVATFGCQLIITVCMTYALESYPEDTTSISAFFAVTRQVYAFIAGFYLPIPYENWGYARASGLFAGLIGICFLTICSCHIWGQRWKTRENAKGVLTA